MMKWYNTIQIVLPIVAVHSSFLGLAIVQYLGYKEMRVSAVSKVILRFFQTSNTEAPHTVLVILVASPGLFNVRLLTDSSEWLILVMTSINTRGSGTR